jgi:hypothetical protein
MGNLTSVRWRTFAIVAALGASGVVAVPVACGGTASGPSPSDAALAPEVPSNAPDCPAGEPADGAGCSKEGLHCEYGSDFNALCNVVVSCRAGHWARQSVHTAPRCPSGLPALPAKAASCPASPSALPPGACGPTTTCEYVDAVCTCGTHCRTVPLPEPICDADAGITTRCCDASSNTWGCFRGLPYCASPRPRVGSACDGAPAPCAVGPVDECGQAALRCLDGTWSLAQPICTTSTARAKQDIAYLDDAQRETLRAQLLAVKLASYRYKEGGDTTHLGFIIEDMPPGSPATLSSRDRVDLYGYTSMTVAAIQQQQKELDALKAQVAQLAAENASLRKRAKAR